MRRSICNVEPVSALAGETRTWRFHYTTSNALPEKTILLFDMVSNCRPIDWELPTTNLKAGSNCIWAEIEGYNKPLQAEMIYNANEFAPKFQFKLPVKVSVNKTITILLGDPKDKKGQLNPKGNRTQITSQRRRPFYLYVDPTGKGKFDEPETFSVDIKGNLLQNIKVIAPSFVAKNKRFDVIIRFEDQYGNLTSNTPNSDTLIALTHEHIRENLNWKLFIPETGFISLPNLYFNEEGVYTITLQNLATKENYRSCPIRCFSDLHTHLFWGSLHGESDRVDSTENIESCLRHFRDEAAFNFFSVSPFESPDETSNELWKVVHQNIQDFNEDDRFSTFMGEQIVGDPGTEGVRQLLFLKEQKQPLRKKDAKYSSLKKLYKAFHPKELLSIPCFTMGKGFHYDFKEFDPEFERVVEIYNAWGSSERSKEEGNNCPIEPLENKGVIETAEGSVIEALKAGCRFGFVAGGLDDRGVYTNFFENMQAQYPAGLTAILAKNLTREGIFEALYERRCYATTGERIILGMQIAGSGMGTVIDTSEKQGLLINRHISGYVAGTKKLHTVEIIRCGEVIHTLHPKEYLIDFEYDDMTALEPHLLTRKEGAPPFVFYYLRVTQEDGHMAWSSPIWIDLLPAVKRERKPPKPSSKVEIKPAEVEEAFEDDFDSFDDDEEDDDDSDE